MSCEAHFLRKMRLNLFFLIADKRNATEPIRPSEHLLCRPVELPPEMLLCRISVPPQGGGHFGLHNPPPFL